MKFQNQWLFETPPRGDKEEKNPDQWLFETPPRGDKEEKGFFAKALDKVAPYVLHGMMAVAGTQVATPATQTQAHPPNTITVTEPRKNNTNDGKKAFKAGIETLVKRHQNQPKKPKNKQKTTGGNPPPSVKIKLPTFTGYPLPPITSKQPAKNSAGFFTREAEVDFLQQTQSKQSQWLFEAPFSTSSLADYSEGTGRKKARRHKNPDEQPTFEPIRKPNSKPPKTPPFRPSADSYPPSLAPEDRARKKAQQLGATLVKEAKSRLEKSNPSGDAVGAQAKIQAGAQLIREANMLRDRLEKDAYRLEGNRLMVQGNSDRHVNKK